jgi:hypothetical protein
MKKITKIHAKEYILNSLKKLSELNVLQSRVEDEELQINRLERIISLLRDITYHNKNGDLGLNTRDIEKLINDLEDKKYTLQGYQDSFLTRMYNYSDYIELTEVVSSHILVPIPLISKIAETTNDLFKNDDVKLIKDIENLAFVLQSMSEIDVVNSAARKNHNTPVKDFSLSTSWSNDFVQSLVSVASKTGYLDKLKKSLDLKPELNDSQVVQFIEKLQLKQSTVSKDNKSPVEHTKKFKNPDLIKKLLKDLIVHATQPIPDRAPPIKKHNKLNIKPKYGL